jgi:hypothetical protein
MATNYTNLLGFALPTTGELSGTWGQVVNDSITELVEDSIAGSATASVTSGDWTLSTTGSGASNEARCAILIPTGTPGTSRNIIAPSSSKAYVVVNQSDGAVVLKGAATTGVTIAAGAKALVAWNGSDFVQVGGTGDVVGPASATDNAIARFDLTSGKLIQNSVVTIADTTGDISGVGTLNATTADLTNLEVTNIKAKDGTASASIADSTGVFTHSTVVLFPDGSVSAPSITNAGDTNTGIYFSADNEVSIATDGTQRVVVNSTGLVGIGNSSPSSYFAGGTNLVIGNASGDVGMTISSGTSSLGRILFADGTSGSAAYQGWIYYTHTDNALSFATAAVERMRITSAGYTQPVAYADTVVALGNTGTAINIDLQTANVFSATLTGSCTFTLQNPIATGSSSFTLILTNDGTAGRTVAWSGGSFNFPGGAGTLSRTTTANATDIWAFFTPNGGTTWYGNIVMKDVKA